MSDDAELLHLYASQHSEPAFAELIRRHVDLVYSAALRLVNGDVHRAQDVTQQVFTELARQAGRVRRHPALVGWLYTTTRRMALRAIRAEQRRHAREREATMMNELLREPASEPDWDRLRPVLEDAMHELSEADRLALLFRFFKNKSLKEVGAELGIGDNAARMRVERALEKLRARLARKGIASTAAMLALTLAEKAATAAPAGLASTITSASLANVAAGGVMWTAALTKLQLSAAGAILIASVAAPWLVQHQADRELREKDALFQREAARLARLQAENLRLAGLFAQANASRATNSSPGELLKLRGEVARLRRGLQEHSPAKPASAAPTNDLLASMAQEWTERGRQLRQWVEEHPAEKIPELQFLTDRDWVDAVYPSRLETEEEYHRALSTLRSNGELRFLDRLWPALDHYLKDHGGRFPADMTQLAAYLNPPVETAILDRYEIVPSRVLVEELQHAGEWVVTEKAAVNETWDVRWAFGVSNGCMADSRVTNRWTTRR